MEVEEEIFLNDVLSFSQNKLKDINLENAENDIEEIENKID
jgi:hypothetical protein